MIKAVIFDRDGTLINYVPYLSSNDDVLFYPGVFDACLKLKQHRILTFIATNQSGIGRGYYSEEDYRKVERFIETSFKDQGCPIQRTYFSPYHPQFGVGKYKKLTQCRKPNPGMIKQIISDYNLNPSQVVMVGDSTVDVLAAKHAGVSSALVRTGLGNDSEQKVDPDFIGDSVLDVVNSYILC